MTSLTSSHQPDDALPNEIVPMIEMQLNQSNHYTILDLDLPQSGRSNSLDSARLKSAYRRALLTHHPDRKSDSSSAQFSVFTIDQITTAYEILSDPTTRAEYDASLLRQRKETGLGRAAERSAVETVDLGELKSRDVDGVEEWFRECRCGSSYQVNEKQLGEAAAEGEILVGCRGCSLVIKITFDSIEE